MNLNYLTEAELEMAREKVNLQIALGLESCKMKADVCQLLDDVREHERFVIAQEVIKDLKSKRYQNQPFYLRWLIWLRWMPYAYLRGIYWYISQLWSDDKGDLEGIHFLVSVSIGDIQATRMHWIYSGAECMAMSKQEVK